MKKDRWEPAGKARGACLSVAIAVAWAGCSSPATADREKFIGTWKGGYGCEGIPPVEDQFVVARGDGPLDFRITVHSKFVNPDVVKGSLTARNLISIPEQRMGGPPGTASVTYRGAGTLDYSQSGLGRKCGGTGYVKVGG